MYTTGCGGNCVGPGATCAWWCPAPWGWPGSGGTGLAKINCPCWDGLGWGWPGEVAAPGKADMLPATKIIQKKVTVNNRVSTWRLGAWGHPYCQPAPRWSSLPWLAKLWRVKFLWQSSWKSWDLNILKKQSCLYDYANDLIKWPCVWLHI